MKLFDIKFTTGNRWEVCSTTIIAIAEDKEEAIELAESISDDSEKLESINEICEVFGNKMVKMVQESIEE